MPGTTKELPKFDLISGYDEIQTALNSSQDLAQCRKELNRPFASCFQSLFQSEGNYKAIDMKTIFYSHANIT